MIQKSSTDADFFQAHPFVLSRFPSVSLVKNRRRTKKTGFRGLAAGERAVRSGKNGVLKRGEAGGRLGRSGLLRDGFNGGERDGDVVHAERLDSGAAEVELKPGGGFVAVGGAGDAEHPADEALAGDAVEGNAFSAICPDIPTRRGRSR